MQATIDFTHDAAIERIATIRARSSLGEMKVKNTMRDFLTFLFGVAAAVACFALLLLNVPCPGVLLSAQQELFLGRSTNGTHAADPSAKNLGMAPAPAPAPGDEKLQELLRRASMENLDKTVIMTFTNQAWSAPGSLQDLFLESFHLGVRTEPLLKHLVIVADGAKAYERCQLVHPLCYHLDVDGGVDDGAEQVYMAKGYLKMMWRRNRFQVRVLQLGYSFVFTDMDIIWLRNPLLRIPIGADLAMSCDKFYGDNPYDLNKAANAGFVYVKASARMLAFYESWYAARLSYPNTHEQYVFQQVKDTLPAQHGIRVQFVDTAYLSGFCELSKDFYKVCTVHANCLVGLKTKLQKLTEVFDEWKQFREKAANTTAITD